MTPIVVDMHFLLACKDPRRYSYFFRVDFRDKNEPSLEGPYTLNIPPSVSKKVKWEYFFILLNALSLMRQRIRATCSHTEREIIVFTDYPKFAKFICNWPNDRVQLPKEIKHLADFAVSDTNTLKISISDKSFKWALRYNGRNILRKYIDGEITQRYVQTKTFNPKRVVKRESGQDTPNNTDGKNEPVPT